MYGVIIEESKGRLLPYTHEHFPESEYERLTRQLKTEGWFTKAGNGVRILQNTMDLTNILKKNCQW